MKFVQRVIDLVRPGYRAFPGLSKPNLYRKTTPTTCLPSDLIRVAAEGLASSGAGWLVRVRDFSGIANSKPNALISWRERKPGQKM